MVGPSTGPTLGCDLRLASKAVERAAHDRDHDRDQQRHQQDSDCQPSEDDGDDDVAIAATVSSPLISMDPKRPRRPGVRRPRPACGWLFRAVALGEVCFRF